MYGKIIIVGPGGSGKDFLKNKMVNKGFKYGVSFTSRPPREGEKEGIDYYYKDEEFFKNNGDIFLELQEFNGWQYGISKKEFSIKNLFILSPPGLKSLPKSLKKGFFVIYLNPSIDIRRKRLAERNDLDNVTRRISADKMDFLNFFNYDLMITNENF